MDKNADIPMHSKTNGHKLDEASSLEPSALDKGDMEGGGGAPEDVVTDMHFDIQLQAVHQQPAVTPVHPHSHLAM